MNRYIWLFSAFLVRQISMAQCPTADFSVVASVCLEQDISLVNSSTDATSYFWDFCVGDLGETPTATNVLNNSSLGTTSQLTVVEDGGNFYAFFLDRTVKRLYRLDFGNSLDEPSPSLVNMGVIDNSLTQPFAMEMVMEGGTWYAFCDRCIRRRLISLDFQFGIDFK